MLTFSFFLASALEVFLPFLLAWFLLRRYPLSLRLFVIGLLTFVGSQLVHIPLVIGLTAYFRAVPLQLSDSYKLVFNAVLLGLLAGVCEETARWIGYRLLKTRADSWPAALALGTGHGGLESFLVGLMVLGNLGLMLLFARGSTGFLNLQTQAAAVLTQQAAAFWATPLYLPLLGALERVFAVTLHLALSVMVWRAVSRRSWLWFLAAVLWHALVDGIAVYLAGIHLNSVALEGVVGLFALGSLGILYWVWRKTHPPIAAALS